MSKNIEELIEALGYVASIFGWFWMLDIVLDDWEGVPDTVRWIVCLYLAGSTILFYYHSERKDAYENRIENLENRLEFMQKNKLH